MFTLDVVDSRLVDSLTGDQACLLELSSMRVRAGPAITTFSAPTHSFGGASLCRQQATVVTTAASGRRTDRRAVVEDPCDDVVEQCDVDVD